MIYRSYELKRAENGVTKKIDAQMTLKMKVKVTHLQYVLKAMLDEHWVQIRSGLVESLMAYRANELKIDENGVKNAQMTLKMNVKVIYF